MQDTDIILKNKKIIFTRFMTPGYRAFYILLILTAAGASCRKVIYPRFKANTTVPVVVQAALSDYKDSASVFISEVLDIYAPNVYTGKNGATVSVMRDDSMPVSLNPLGNGRYGGNLGAIPGHHYLLKVDLGGTSYTATTVMPPKVPFDSLFITHRTVLGREMRIPTVRFTDPPGNENYYRFVLSVDGFESTTIFIETDKLFNGNKMTLELLDLFTDSKAPTFVDKFDKVIVEMQCISKQTYQYLYQLNASALGQGNSLNPGNPQSNITGGALGYFSVHSSEKKTIFAD
ncbi:DUF4249 domain-containing protein [Niabella hirudinis]|uniref:DUF4249 domain-containing protein n=1 Tax=Niabella hirudinis TaxID=1285929 RepID=UPI003EBDFE89